MGDCKKRSDRRIQLEIILFYAFVVSNSTQAMLMLILNLNFKFSRTRFAVRREFAFDFAVDRGVRKILV